MRKSADTLDIAASLTLAIHFLPLHLRATRTYVLLQVTANMEEFKELKWPYVHRYVRRHNLPHNFCTRLSCCACEVWAAHQLKLKLVIATGPLSKDVCATQVHGQGEEMIWLWSRQSLDGAGCEASQFDLISKAGEPSWC